MGIEMDNRRAPYLQLADLLRAFIQGGRHSPGDQLPTVANLATQYGVAKMTMQRALDVLRMEGYVSSWQGRGTFVRNTDLGNHNRREDHGGQPGVRPGSDAALGAGLDDAGDRERDGAGRPVRGTAPDRALMRRYEAAAIGYQDDDHERASRVLYVDIEDRDRAETVMSLSQSEALQLAADILDAVARIRRELNGEQH